MDAHIALVIANVALVIATLFYLWETRQIRKITEKSFLVENSPKVFLENVVSVPNLNQSAKQIDIAPLFQIVNVGKTEAKNFCINYTLSSGKLKLEDKADPIPSLYPGQHINYTTKLIWVALNDEQVAVPKASILAKTPYTIPVSSPTPIIFDLTLSYLDQQMQEQKSSWKLEYIIQANYWVLKGAE